MNENKRNFDEFADSYEQLLRDPLRERFSPGGSGFFHARKCELIRDHFRRRGLDTRQLAYLDYGCGRGELLSRLGGDFRLAAGCDTSAGMLRAGDLAAQGVEARLQQVPARVPFDDAEFDAATAVSVLHHVEPEARPALLKELRRVLKPGGTLGVIEHNPYNPVTRRIVARALVDRDARLVRPAELRGLLRAAGFRVESQSYFLYLPEPLYGRLAWLERALRGVPLGGQYAVFGRVI